jgi:hypothetical protein
MLLVPVRYFIVPRLGFTREELDILDGPVASPFVSRTRPARDQADAEKTMESVGGERRA